MFSWRTTFFENVFLDVDNENDVFGNRLEFVLPRMKYLLDNNNFQTALYFNWFCTSTFLKMVEMVLERSVYFWTGVVLQNNTGMYICNICKCMWMWISVFSFFCFSWNLRYETLEMKCMLHVLIGSSMLHDRIKETKDHCTVADRARTSYKLPLLVSCVA